MCLAGAPVTRSSQCTQTTRTWRPRGRSKSDISRAIIWVTPFRVLIPRRITHLLSPLNLQVHVFCATGKRIGGCFFASSASAENLSECNFPSPVNRRRENHQHKLQSFLNSLSHPRTSAAKARKRLDPVISRIQQTRPKPQTLNPRTLNPKPLNRKASIISISWRPCQT